MNKKKKLIIIPVLLILGIAGFFIFLAIREELPYWQADKYSDALASEYAPYNKPGGSESNAGDALSNDTAPTNREVGPIGNDIDFNGLQAMNPDIIGWIYIPGTQVNYPIMKHETDEFYLNHNSAKEYNILGSIFCPSKTAEDLSDAHTILYGHNMRSGQMFGEISNYADPDFRSNNSKVYIYTPEKSMEAVIYAAYGCKADSEIYRIGFDKGTKEFKEFIKTTLNNRYYDSGEEPSVTDAIFTLSTCADAGVESDRFVVNCYVERVIDKWRRQFPLRSE